VEAGSLLSSLAGIVRVDPITGSQSWVASALPGAPVDLDIGPKGDLFVLFADISLGPDWGILRIDPTGSTQMVIAPLGSLTDPGGIAIDATGQLLVTTADVGNGSAECCGSIRQQGARASSPQEAISCFR